MSCKTPKANGCWQLKAVLQFAYSGLLPWDAPVMIAEKRELFFLFSAICFSERLEYDSCLKEGLHAESEHHTAVGSMSAQASIHFHASIN